MPDSEPGNGGLDLSIVIVMAVVFLLIGLLFWWAGIPPYDPEMPFYGPF